MVESREPNASSRHALVAGGGTGGHVFPALALAATLDERGWTVSFVGRAGSLEERLANRHGIPFLTLPAAPLVGASVLQKAATLWTTLRSALKARRLVREVGADVVVGMGGYVSVPAVLGARLAGRPIVLFEPNASVGVANRWLSRWSREAAVAYAAAGDRLSCPVVVTGTPVRADFFRQDEPDSGGDPRLLVLGGSQGARQLNEWLPLALAAVADRIGALGVLHQAGVGNVESTRAAYETQSLAQIEVDVVDFLDDVASAMGAAQLVVSRAGAVTLAELCAAGRAAFLVPLELAGGHQRTNARELVEAGAAEVLPRDADAAALGEGLCRLLTDRERLRAMGQAARSLARPDAAERLADRVVAAGGGG